MGGIDDTDGNSFNSVTSNVRSTTIVPLLTLLSDPFSLSSLLLRVENFEVGTLVGLEVILTFLEVLSLEVAWEEFRLGVRSKLEKWWKNLGSVREARGRRADSEAHIIAVPTSTTDQFREPTV